ncbi:DUF6194 family protein [Marinactinospora thermotolerans]|nr:DUF6194 family protein [Marinactinospora thermotolerans]
MEITRHDPTTDARSGEEPVFAPEEIIAFTSGLPGVTAFTAAEGDGSPEIAWGDTFFLYDPEGEGMGAQRMPFATIVVKDYDGFDTASELNRPGVFRLNISVGRTAFEELVGYPPAAHADQAAEIDYTVTDRIIPHPVYAPQSWVAVVNPGPTTRERVRDLLTDAHARAVRRHRPRG